MNYAQYSITLSLVFFAISAGMHLQAFPSHGQSKKLPILAFWAFTIGALSVTAGIILFLQEPLSQPMSGVFLVFSISWITVLGQVLFKMRTMGTFVAPICTVLLLFHLFLVPGHSVSSPPPSNFANFHIYVYPSKRTAVIYTVLQQF